MASNRHPSVTIPFKDKDEDYRFYLSLKELFALRDDHPVVNDDSLVYGLLANFEYEPGDRVEGVTVGVGNEFATVVKVVSRHGVYTEYEVNPDIPPAPPPIPSKWRFWRNRNKPAPQPIIWPSERTPYIQHLLDTPSSLDETKQD